MDGNDTNGNADATNQDVNIDANGVGIENQEGQQASQEQVQPTQAEIAEMYLKEQGFEFENLDDLRTPKKVVETVNPYEGLLDDEDKAYFEYKKETGRSRKDFEALKTNLDDLPRINLAREKVRNDTGLNNLTDAQADEYLSDTLGIDIEEMSGSDEIKLAQFTKSILEEKKAEQNKYRKPTENKQQASQEDSKQEYVRLDNGSVMLKSEYDNLLITRQKEINDAKEAVNSVTDSSFEVAFDDNGTERKEAFGYEFDEKDRHSMVSVVSDLDSYVATKYRSEKGFNHKQFAEDMFWTDSKNREKVISSIVHKAIAKNTEEVLKQRGNVNYNPHRTLPQGTKDGVKVVSVKDALHGKI